ncbi:MAG: hypothetical protein COB53_08870 [Elusimicrobia bacterium]|nr:MAG: hypothetical protein COB53_08870 [Elusimicrobiota bacterium]
MSRPIRLLLVAIHFVCPLIFFTDLTRNPYFTQIASLNLGLLAAFVWHLFAQSKDGDWRMPRTPVDPAWIVFGLVAAASWAYAYFGHAAVFRESIRAEGLRVSLFLIINAAIPFHLASVWSSQRDEAESSSIFHWLLFAAVWAVLWSFFPQLRGAPKPGSQALWDHIFDPYGMFVWIVGIGWVLRLARDGGQAALRHAFLTVGTVAAVYGIGQYFSIEFFWPKVLNPYGGRSVSTFGNPNFMSSYMVMLLPLVMVHYLEAPTRAKRTAYAFMFLLFEASLLCSLTRSSWVGAAAALAPLLFSRRLRALARRDLEFHGLTASAVLFVALLWPSSNVSGYAPSVIGRISEMADMFSSSAENQGAPYSPLHQRFLIWLCCWTMGSENPLLGKGWGTLELFYPFYQGHFVDQFEIYRNLRTHANNAHNELVETFCQTGILGLGTMVWMWVIFYWSVGRAFVSNWALSSDAPSEEKKRKKQTPVEAPLPNEPVWVLASAASVFGMLVDNLLNVSIHFAVPGFFFWWQAGTAMGMLSRGDRGRRIVFPGKAMAFGCAAIVAGACILGGSYWVRHWNREVQYFLGFKFMRQGDPAGALKHLEAAYAWHPREVNTNYELGNAYARTNKHEKAIWAYQEALKANAGYDEIYFNIGTILSLKLGKREEAIRNFNVSWAVNPLSKQTYLNFASVLLSGDGPQKHGDLAVAVLSRAAYYFPEEANFLLNLGSLHTIRGNLGKAIDVYSRLLRQRPELRNAEQNLRRVIQQQAGDLSPPIIAELDEYHDLSGRLAKRVYDQESLAMARRAFERFPDSVQVKFFLGNLEMMQGDPLRAELLLRSVHNAQRGSVPVLMNLAQVLHRNGKTAEAKAMFRAILQTEPNNAFAKQQLFQLGG